MKAHLVALILAAAFLLALVGIVRGGRGRSGRSVQVLFTSRALLIAAAGGAAVVVGLAIAVWRLMSKAGA